MHQAALDGSQKILKESDRWSAPVDQAYHCSLFADKSGLTWKRPPITSLEWLSAYKIEAFTSYRTNFASKNLPNTLQRNSPLRTSLEMKSINGQVSLTRQSKPVHNTGCESDFVLNSCRALGPEPRINQPYKVGNQGLEYPKMASWNIKAFAKTTRCWSKCPLGDVSYFNCFKFFETFLSYIMPRLNSCWVQFCWLIFLRNGTQFSGTYRSKNLNFPV